MKYNAYMSGYNAHYSFTELDGNVNNCKHRHRSGGRGGGRRPPIIWMGGIAPPPIISYDHILNYKIARFPALLKP